MDQLAAPTVTVTGVVLDQAGQPVTGGTIRPRRRAALDRATQAATHVTRTPRITHTGAGHARRQIPWATIRTRAGWTARALAAALAVALVVAAATWIHGLDTLGRAAVAVGVTWALVTAWAMDWTPSAAHHRPAPRQSTPTAPQQVTITCPVTDNPGARQRALPAGRRAITQ